MTGGGRWCFSTLGGDTKLAVPSWAKRDLAIEGSFPRAGRRGALGRGVAEEDHRADELVAPLPDRLDAQRQLLPVVGRLDPLASLRPHRSHRRVVPTAGR